ncbi:hypothetical protein RCL1_003061 [Eukaryota sp. TZLM3-RCL]
MPPKKSKSAVPTSDLEEVVNQLKARVTELEAEVATSLSERNFFQLDRDKINSLWEITRKDLELSQAELRNKEAEMAELEERHQAKIMLFKQHSHHLAHEHQNNITLLKKQQEDAIRKLQEDYLKKESEMRQQKAELKAQLRELKLSHENTTWSLIQDFDKNVSQIREQTELQIRQLQKKFEERLKQQREQLEERFKNELDELENTKNEHIQLLMSQHDEAFAGIKNYYTDITRNNVEMIKKYKAEVAKMRRSEAAQEKLMFEVCQDNKKMREPLQQAQREVEKLRHQVANHEKDKASLSRATARLRDTETQLRNMSWEHEVLVQRFGQLEKERDELYNNFESLIQQIQQKAGLKNLVLHKKVAVLADELERKEAQLTEVLHLAAGNQVVNHAQVKNGGQGVEVSHAISH